MDAVTLGRGARVSVAVASVLAVALGDSDNVAGLVADVVGVSDTEPKALPVTAAVVAAERLPLAEPSALPLAARVADALPLAVCGAVGAALPEPRAALPLGVPERRGVVDTDAVADDERVDTREPDTDELERTLREALGEPLTLPLPDALGLPDGEREPLRDGAAVRESLAQSEDEPVPR